MARCDRCPRRCRLAAPERALHARIGGTPRRRAPPLIRVQQQQQQQASQFTTPRRPRRCPCPHYPPFPLHLLVTVPTISTSTLSAMPAPTFTSMSSPALASSPAQAQALAGIVVFESTLATFQYPLPPANADRRAAMRVAKAVIQSGQQQQ